MDDSVANRVLSSLVYIASSSRISPLILLYTFFVLSFSVPKSPLLVVLGKPFDCVEKSDFYQLVVNDGTFVDKTAFIEDYLSRWKSRNLILRPRRFGKSLNMDMLRRFLEIEVDENGQVIPEADSINRKLFLGGSIKLGNDNETKLLKPLKVSRSVPIVKQLGEFPVIFASFKNIRGNTYQQFEANMKGYVMDLLGEYHYLRKNMTDEMRAIFDSYQSGNMTEIGLDNCFDYLSRKLQVYFNHKVHILIDDYDAPLQNMLTDVLGNRAADLQTLQRAIDSDDFKNATKLIARIIGNSLMTCPAVEQGLVTGMFPLGKTDMAPELKDIREYSPLNKPFAEYFGFYGHEINEITRDAMRNKNKEIDRLYKIYNFAGKMLYNPYSVMRCLQTVGDCADYWAQTGSMKYVEHLLSNSSFQQQVQYIFAGEIVNLHVKNSKFSYNDFISGELIRYLLFTGYLTPITHKKKDDVIKLKVPNYEVKQAYKGEILKWAKNKFNFTEKDYSKASELLIGDKVLPFQMWLETDFKHPIQS